MVLFRPRSNTAESPPPTRHQRGFSRRDVGPPQDSGPQKSLSQRVIKPRIIKMESGTKLPHSVRAAKWITIG